MRLTGPEGRSGLQGSRLKEQRDRAEENVTIIEEKYVEYTRKNIWKGIDY